MLHKNQESTQPSTSYSQAVLKTGPTPTDPVTIELDTISPLSQTECDLTALAEYNGRPPPISDQKNTL